MLQHLHELGGQAQKGWQITYTHRYLAQVQGRTRATRTPRQQHTSIALARNRAAHTLLS